MRMKKNSWRFFGSLLGPGCCEFNVRIGVMRRDGLGVGAWAGELELRHLSCKQSKRNQRYQDFNHMPRFDRMRILFSEIVE